MKFRIIFAITVVGAISSMASTVPSSVTDFVKTHCMDCHDEETAKGDRSFQAFLKAPSAGEHIHTLEEILEQLILGEMPPEKKSVTQPPAESKRRVIKEITEYLTAMEASSKPTSTVLRRLTRYEYNNTIRDLLGIDTEASDKTRLFPPDPRTHGFANLGTSQALSDHQLELYMEAAKEYLDLALFFGDEKPATQKWDFTAADFNGEKKNPGSVRYRVWANDKSHIDIGHGQPVENGPTYPKAFARKGVPESGYYRIRVNATAVGRKHPYDPALFPNDLSVPLQMGLWHVPDDSFLSLRASEGRVLIKTFDLPDENPEIHEATVWMPAGSIPFVHWINGPGASKRFLRIISEQYHTEAIRKSQTKVDQLRAQGLPVPDDALVQKVWISDVYQGPRVRVFEMTIEGPLNETWPPKSHQNIAGSSTDVSKINVAELLSSFASKAFRRPVQLNEIKHYVDYVRSEMKSGVRKTDAIKQGLSAILTSPRFLFLDEGDSSVAGPLDDYQLANRLSYTLWSSMPDASLLKQAQSKELRQEDTLSFEVDRLIDDPRFSAFSQHFSDAWLALYKIGTMPPAGKQFPAYYRDRLEESMKMETRLFLQDAIRNNRPITHLLNAKESFLNGSMAKHYALSDVQGDQFVKVGFPAKSRRSGLLGHASVLTATANGVETSPVVRGVWVLENILGTPPSPPPPDVPPIEPDTRGATTIREQLAKHRNVQACADCHAKIDPWGFALEYFDPIGGFRTHYPRIDAGGRVTSRPGQPVDGSGRLPSGISIKNETELNAQLLERKDQFNKTLIRKFLTYATGREMTFRDQEEIDKIATDVASAGYGFRDLIKHSIQSNIFRNR